LMKNMEHELAMQIVGLVAVMIGLAMNADPVGFNQRIFGDVEGLDTGPSSAMRMAIGGGPMGIGSILLWCSFNVDDAASSEAILIGTAIGLGVFFSTVAGAKLRGYVDHFPVLPMVILPMLIAICLYSAMS